MKLIDLTQTFTPDMPVFPGDPPAEIRQTIFIEKSGNNDHELHTPMHVGTHMDAPLHMIAGGRRIDELPIETFIGNGVLIDARGEKEIGVELLKKVAIQKGDVVLVMTGLGNKFGEEEYFNNYPAMTQAFTDMLVQKQIRMIGMDCASPEHNPPWEIHKTFLRNNICILENLTNLEALEKIDNFEVIALPMKLQADGAPVRVVAKIL